MACQGKEYTHISTALPLGQGRRLPLHQVSPHSSGGSNSITHFALFPASSLPSGWCWHTRPKDALCYQHNSAGNQTIKWKFGGQATQLLSKSKYPLMLVEVLFQREAYVSDRSGCCHSAHVPDLKLRLLWLCQGARFYKVLHKQRYGWASGELITRATELNFLY